jgi:hypothetical protein
MRNAVIVHGMPLKAMYLDPATPRPSNYHWLPWLRDTLDGSGVRAQAPEMRRPYEPDYGEWKRVMEALEVGPDTTLVGHGGGAGFLLRWLSQRTDLRARKLVLVAPWIDPQRDRTGVFFDFVIDRGLTARIPVVISYSDNDDATIIETVRRIHDALPEATERRFHLGHFSHYDMPSREFPKLLDEALR